MEHDILIEARGLTRRYGPNVAVESIDLTLRRGEILGLLGPNGAGKSTTMKMLTGNLAPTGGTVKINGIDLAADPKSAKRAIGYLPEQPPVHPELTVDEYLEFAAALHGVAKKDRAAALQRAKQACGLSEVSRRLIGNLSKGYQQRVGLAQAIIHRPPVIILDEPTVGLDPIQIREIRSLIATLAKEHSVILSSHILPEIQAVCSRVLIVNRGRVVFHESLAKLASEAVPSYFVQFSRPPEHLELPGVSAISALGEGRYRIESDPSFDPREALVERSVANGWGLLELRRQTRSLEEIFVSLTSGEATELRKAA
jgi:ABC-2 type transport system ATP-binding protein